MRIAFFTDSYLEVNGVAVTSRRLEQFARQREYPFLTVYAGPQTENTRDGSVEKLQLKRSPMSVPMDAGLAFDLLFARHAKMVRRKLREFRPDVVHITGLNDVSMLGVVLAHRLAIPVLASWHTNLHEFAAARLDQSMRFLPGAARKPLVKLAEQTLLQGALLYYRLGHVLLAPNQELVDLLHKGSQRAAFLMTRGVDTGLFAPTRRTVDDNRLRIGFCGRLQPEKNLRLLAELEKDLIAAGKTDYEFLIVGDGSERAWLEQNLRQARFTGFLKGEELAENYANMDVFVFPSETDTFGNVVQEAFASGVPAIVANVGGPKFIVKSGENGFVAENVPDFARRVIELMDDRPKLRRMSDAARQFALAQSWDAVFEKVYQAYAESRVQHRLRDERRKKISVASTT